MRKRFLFLSMALCLAAVQAQAAPPSRLAPSESRMPASQDAPVHDDVSLEDYLQVLTQISPAARAGADTYLQAFQQRCGKPMKAIELRRAVANGSGDPTLMAMIRAAAQHDTATLQRLSEEVNCTPGY